VVASAKGLGAVQVARRALTARGHARRRRAATPAALSVLLAVAVATLVYTSLQAGSALAGTRDLERVRDLAELSRSAAGLTSKLQAERTHTVGFVAARAAGVDRDIGTVAVLRRAADAELAAFRRAAARRGGASRPTRRALSPPPSSGWTGSTACARP
jgi:hypothetical protein